MQSTFRLAAFLTLTCWASWAASFNFSGAVFSSSGVFAPLNGASVSGSVEATFAPDSAAGDATFGSFAAEIASFSLLAGPFNLSFTVPSTFEPTVTVETNFTEVFQNIRVVATYAGAEVDITLTGSAGFLTSDEFPGGVNWSLFTTGSGSVTTFLNVASASDPINEAVGDQFLFTVESVSEVPEPGSLALVAAGLIGAATLRRRFIR
jgi:hypothetical protein